MRMALHASICQVGLAEVSLGQDGVKASRGLPLIYPVYDIERIYPQLEAEGRVA